MALARSRYLKALYEKFFQATPREFIGLLHYCHRHRVSGENLEESVARLLDRNPDNITVEMITVLLGNKPEEERVSFPQNSETLKRAKEQLQKITRML